MTFLSINPYDQTIINEHSLIEKSEILEIISTAEQRFATWRKSSFSERRECLFSLAKTLREGKEKFALIMAMEMGKILTEGRAEIEKCAITTEYYAENGEKFLQDEKISAGGHDSYLSFEPIGAIFAIMPWNFPFWQVIRFAAPTLMAGNVILLKHSPNVCNCARALEDIFLAAGFPKGCFQTLIIDTADCEMIIAQDIVQAVTLTGSEYAGSAVAAIAGKHLKKSVLELGGSDPLIVLPDANLEKAATVALQSRMLNAGQSCIAAKRWLVFEEVYEDFLEKILQKMSNLVQGNPILPETTTGPIARLDLAEKLSLQMRKSLEKGATLAFGGNCEGCNFEPALLLNISPEMSVMSEETFGPLASIFVVKSEEQALFYANQTRYGLGASIWTQDLERAKRMAKEIVSGSVFINSLVKSDARLPFGGVKKSGYGRELSELGMKEFVNVKTIFVED